MHSAACKPELHQVFIGTQDLAASEKFVFGSDLKRGLRGAVSSRDQPRWSPPPGATRLILRMGLETRQVQSVKQPTFHQGAEPAASIWLGSLPQTSRMVLTVGLSGDCSQMDLRRDKDMCKRFM